MVQPPTPASSVAGSEAARSAASPVRLTERNHSSFKLTLRGEASSPRALQVQGPAACEADREIAQSPPQKPLLEGSWTSLAPEEQSGQGRALDPAEWLATITAAGGGDSSTAPVAAAPAPLRGAEPPLAELVEGWVRRVALGGDSRRGVAKLDIAHGTYAGSSLLIAAEAGHVTVELTLPAGSADAGLADRLEQRLAARGYAADVAVR